MGAMAGRLAARRLSRDAILLCVSACFADLGYQGVTALFPLYIVFRLHAAVAWYGVITAVAFGGGAAVGYLGGRAGDRVDRKYLIIAGNAFIPLMALSGLAHMLWLAGLLFILGWWARYFRTPVRQALLVLVTRPDDRGLAFGFLHALDIAGGMFSALIALLLISIGLKIETVMLWAVVPLAISTVVLLFVQRTELFHESTPLSMVAPRAKQTGGIEPTGGAEHSGAGERTLLIWLLVSATLYGFSFYNLGFPILSAAHGHGATGYGATRGYELGVLAYVVYLGVSAVSGYALGAGRVPALRSLWLLGYLPSALASGLIGVSQLLHLSAIAFYLFIAMLGLGMGGVETQEPTLVSSLVRSTRLSRGMGFLTVSRSIGQFLSNLVMGLLFTLSSSVPYFYAFASACLAAVVLAIAELRYRAHAHARADRA
ncbi:MAG: MFS transporter [Acetobacteraceae bacterium]